MKFGLLILLLTFSNRAWTQDSERDFTFATPTLAGSGCPRGTTSVVMAPDNKTVSILFDQFMAEVPQYNGDNDNDDETNTDGPRRRNNENLDHKVCSILLDADIPAGYKVKALEVTFDFRGYTTAEKGATAAFKSYMMEKKGLGFRGRKKKNIIHQEVWNPMGRNGSGMIDTDWSISESTVIPVNSGCAVRRGHRNRIRVSGRGPINNEHQLRLKIKNILKAQIGSRAVDNGMDTSALITMDSADISGNGKRGMSFKVQLKKCGNGRVGNPGRGRGNGRGNGHIGPRPNRPRPHGPRPRPRGRSVSRGRSFHWSFSL